ncbi:MAG TPA: TonB-dependent receptor [Rhizomicrobium sp.]|jgi:outer membrane receptor protein involved in Fe transport|nr:TonB-dependent receptor [Rhizomicrobium sp.]
MYRFLLSCAACALFATPAFAQAIESVTVTAERLGEARTGLQTQIGASTYTVTAQALQDAPGGDNALLNQVLLQMPSVVQDSFGQVHIRGEHNALQYRINGIILPEGISVFGQTLDPRLASSVELLTGALPAEYGLDTGGVVDIKTKSGLFDSGGHVSMYGGSHNTLEPSFDYGGSSGSFNYFVSGDYNINSLGIESPDGSHTPEHDRTTQYHGFAFLEDVLDQNSSVTAILGISDGIFQIPNQSGLQPSGIGGIVGLGALDPDSGNYLLKANGQTAFLSDNQDERQRERTDYATISYLHSQGALDFQLSVFGRFSSLFFTPGAGVGDILYNGIAQTAYKRDAAYGTQDEGAWHLGSHTIRFGVVYEADDLASMASSLVLPVANGSAATARLNPNPLCTDPAQTCQISATPLNIPDNSTKHAWSASGYIQDEWKISQDFTVNYGVRYDQYGAFSSGDQVSPRVNAVWTPLNGTIVHVGYSRYYSPPPIELVSSTDVSLFDNTTAAANTDMDTTPVAEHADYYDAGISQQIFTGLKLGLDGYYKLSKDLIDEGQFGAPIILTPFNYARGRQYGGELTADYTVDNLTAYANFSLEHSIGEDWVSSEFNFNPDDFAYVMNHFIDLDHEQHATASAGIDYRWANTVFSADTIYGTGLRQSLTLPSGQNIPNGDHVPAYGVVNLGISHDLSDIGWNGLTARADVTNVFDIDYQIRSGSGVGVFAPQYGQRRGFFFGLSKAL